ncbi:MAG: polyphosphate:AMP phosphotransferase, partial [Macromonas sp.]
MFESAEIGHCIDKKTFKQEAPKLRKALLDAQYRLLEEAKTAVVILVNGVDGAGKGETVNILNEWMDPRHIRTEAFGPLARSEALQHPELYRFWQVLPPKGHIGILFGSWYSDPIEARVHGEDKQDRFARRLERIRQFERMLVAEGVVLIKLWFHLSKSAAKTRLKALASDPKTAWRVTPQEWDNLKHYKEFVEVSDEALRKTSIGQAPWVVIEGTDPAYRYLTAGRHLLHVLQAHTGQAPQPPLAALPAPFHVPEATPTEAPVPARKKRAAP